jgi:hypothetical protein
MWLISSTNRNTDVAMSDTHASENSYRPAFDSLRPGLSNWRAAGAVVLALVSLLAVLALTTAYATAREEMLTRNTVRLALAWFTAALLLMMRLTPADWSASSYLGWLARWCWTWAIVCFLVHLTAAFQFYHGWSHTHAFETTRQVSGTGEGIFALYSFMAVWVVDATWWWAWPKQYAIRSPWFDRALHGFLLFIVFNGMIVFESGFIRWAGIVLFCVLPIAWVKTRGMPRLRPT